MADTSAETQLTPVKQFMLFGSIDGLTMFLGLVFGLIVAAQSRGAAWHAALGGGMGELVGMSTGQYMSDHRKDIKVALACGASGAVACAAPGIPFAILASRPLDIVLSACIALVMGAWIAWQRPEVGVSAIMRTYGVLLGAGLLSGLTGLL